MLSGSGEGVGLGVALGRSLTVIGSANSRLGTGMSADSR